MSNFSDSSLFLLGTSHQVANLNERESIGLPNDSLNNFYQGLEKLKGLKETIVLNTCLLYTSPSPRDATLSRMPSSA